MKNDRYEEITAEEAVKRISKNKKWKQPYTTRSKDGKFYMDMNRLLKSVKESA